MHFEYKLSTNQIIVPGDQERSVVFFNDIKKYQGIKQNL